MPTRYILVYKYISFLSMDVYEGVVTQLVAKPLSPLLARVYVFTSHSFSVPELPPIPGYMSRSHSSLVGTNEGRIFNHTFLDAIFSGKEIFGGHLFCVFLPFRGQPNQSFPP